VPRRMHDQVAEAVGRRRRGLAVARRHLVAEVAAAHVATLAEQVERAAQRVHRDARVAAPEDLELRVLVVVIAVLPGVEAQTQFVGERGEFLLPPLLGLPAQVGNEADQRDEAAHQEEDQRRFHGANGSVPPRTLRSCARYFFAPAVSWIFATAARDAAAIAASASLVHAIRYGSDSGAPSAASERIASRRWSFASPGFAWASSFAAAPEGLVSMPAFALAQNACSSRWNRNRSRASVAALRTFALGSRSASSSGATASMASSLA